MLPPGSWDLLAKAGKAAGGWIAAKAKPYVDAADRAARTASRRIQAKIVDTLSEPVADASREYQDAKAKVVATRKKVRETVAKVKKTFGMETPQCPTKKCPLANGNGPAPDGSLMIPSDNCEKDYIPIPANKDGGAKAAFKVAKDMSPSSTSKCCAAKPASERNKTIIYVNGINTPPAAHCKTLRMIRDMTCAKVVGVMNSTEGMVTDSIRTGDARDMIKKEIGGGAPRTYAGFSPAVTTMKDIMMTEAAAGNPVNIMAHSEGGAITSLATIRAKKALASGGMGDAISNVNITSMGSAAPAWADGPTYTHYLHANDPVPTLLGLGDAAARPGSGAKIVRFGGDNTGYSTKGDKGFKNPYAATSIDDHLADTSYLPYINEKNGGCHGKP